MTTQCVAANDIFDNLHFAERQEVSFTYVSGDVLEIEEQQTCILHLYSLSVMKTNTGMPGLLAYYSFDTGSAKDDSGNGRDGVRTGTEAYEEGRIGAKAAKFDGQSRVIADAFQNFEWGDQFSVSLWFKRTCDCGTYESILSNGYTMQAPGKSAWAAKAEVPC